MHQSCKPWMVVSPEFQQQAAANFFSRRADDQDEEDEEIHARPDDVDELDEIGFMEMNERKSSGGRKHNHWLHHRSWKLTAVADAATATDSKLLEKESSELSLL